MNRIFATYGRKQIPKGSSKLQSKKERRKRANQETLEKPMNNEPWSKEGEKEELFDFGTNS